MIKVKTSQIIKLVLFFLGLGILFFLIRRVGFSEILNTISKADFRFVFLGVFSYIILILVRALKWLLLIHLTENKITYKQLLPVCLANSLLRNFTPLRSGELAVPLLLKKYLKIPVGQGLSVFFLDRFLELAVFTLILLWSLFYLNTAVVQDGLGLSVLTQGFFLLVLLCAVLLLVMLSKKTVFKILRALNFLKRHSFLKRALEFIEKELHVFYDTLPVFKNRKLYQFVIPLTLLSWLLEILSFYFVFSSVIVLPIVKVSAAQIIATAATLVTFLPGGIGIAEGGAVYILKLFGFASVLTLSGALMARIFLTGTLLITGIAGSLMLKEKKETQEKV